MLHLRLQRTSDARRFFEILNNPNFVFFNVKPKSLKDEIAWLKGNPLRRKNNTEWNYTILQNKTVVGAIGVKINFHRKYIGEIGYFIDEAYWGKGIATRAVKLLEPICFKQLKLTRLEIIMQPANIASEKVAIKNGYFKEGLMKKVLRYKNGDTRDCLLYAKTR